jgi:predicted acetylornithine/succinylornithine family transaminase
MTNAEIIRLSDRYLFPVYPRVPLALVRGEGTRVWDGDGRSYLDFFSSTVVTALGHCHAAVTRAIDSQARQILHVSNLHYSEPQARLAEILVEHSFADRVFLCNSGAEANEAAIKLARRYGHDRGGGRYEVVTALGSFHGRTLGTISATGQEKVRTGFEPSLPGFRYAPYDDVAAVEAALSPKTIAVMVEPVQGESGVIVPKQDYLQRLRQLCDRHDLLLILDEVQTGVGRTGTLFAYEQAGIVPDIITLAKGLGNGVPIGAMLARESVAQSFQQGSHGSTFGGNALACAAAVAVMQTLVSEGVLSSCVAMGQRLHEGLASLADRHPSIREVRGMGLLVGVELTEPAAAVVDRCREHGLIVNATGDKVVRFAPPLIVSAAEVDEAVQLFAQALGHEA